MDSQCKMIVDFITEHGSITSLDAIEALGCHRLAARISDLKRSGYDISSEMVTVRNRFGNPCRVAQYRMVDR